MKNSPSAAGTVVGAPLRRPPTDWGGGKRIHSKGGNVEAEAGQAAAAARAAQVEEREV